MEPNCESIMTVKVATHSFTQQGQDPTISNRCWSMHTHKEQLHVHAPSSTMRSMNMTPRWSNLLSISDLVHLIRLDLRLSNMVHTLGLRGPVYRSRLAKHGELVLKLKSVLEKDMRDNNRKGKTFNTNF